MSGRRAGRNQRSAPSSHTRHILDTGFNSRRCRQCVWRNSWPKRWLAFRAVAPRAMHSTLYGQQRQLHSQFARADVRRMAVLKTWVDNLGMQPGWSPAIAPAPFDAKKWFSPRDNWDDEQIGLLARPAPALPELERN